MSINVADNFSYKGAKPLDARTKYDSVANMVATPVADLYDGCLAYVTATKKNYQYDSTNTADPTLGKWRELSTGGGGGSTYTAGTGIDITNDVISTKQSQSGDIDEIIDIYPTAGNLVSIVNAFNRGDIYSEGERMVGQWADRKPLYKKTVAIPLTARNAGGSTVAYNIRNENPTLDSFVRYEVAAVVITPFGDHQYLNPNMVKNSANTGITYTDNGYGINDYQSANDRIITFTNSYTDGGGTAYLTMYYTKFDDEAVSIGEATEYSTEEKVIGTWLDGKAIFQRTVQISAQQISTGGTHIQELDSLASTVDVITNCFATRLSTSSYGTAYLPLIAYINGGTTFTAYSMTAFSGMTHITVQYTKITP